jgi:leucyl aminopeptidase (aminopeptidase T)
MNEQIKQLWEEAAKTTQSDSWEEQTKFMERFAELIVRECASIASNPATGCYTSFGNDIKKHFGVEE